MEPSILKAKYAHPLEREYEAWVVEAIERYFARTGQRYALWAVSPAEEVAWPADEYLFSAYKLVGLQFKQAKLMKNQPATFDRLHWSLHEPAGQFELVQSTPEIFYCLPTFVNRAFRKEALDHCLFWRPEDDKPNKNVWYDNSAARTPYKTVRSARRWGSFIEDLLACVIGKRITSPQQARNYVKKLHSSALELRPRQSDQGVNTTFYALAVELPLQEPS